MAALLIKSGKVITMDNRIYEKADILVEDGKIMDIREEININCEVIDAKGLTVLPGFIEAHSHIGIEEPNNENPGNLNELSSPITPHLNGLDGVNYFDESFEKALKNGITTIATGPGSANVIGGTFSILKTYGSPLNKIFKNKSSMKAALGDNPKRIYSSKGKAPFTKMAIASMIKDTLDSTIAYKNKKIIKTNKKEYFEENKIYEEMIPVIEGKMPLSVHAHRADDIIVALRIADEYKINLQLLHVTEGLKLIDEIKNQNIPCIIGPLMSFSKKVETKNKDYSIGKEFSKKGILTAITTDHPVVPIEYLTISAGLCVREGMDYMEALKSITINPAKILGIDRKVGSIEVGKDADIVIIEGKPLEVMSKVRYVVGKGKLVYKLK